MADQNVPHYQHANGADFVNFFLRAAFSTWKVRGVHFVTGGVICYGCLNIVTICSRTYIRQKF